MRRRRTVASPGKVIADRLAISEHTTDRTPHFPRGSAASRGKLQTPSSFSKTETDAYSTVPHHRKVDTAETSTDRMRKGLLVEYAVALLAEGSAWDQLRAPGLGEAERLESVERLRAARARLKLIKQQLRSTAISVDESRPQPVGEREKEPNEPQEPFSRARLHVSAVAVSCRDMVRAATARFQRPREAVNGDTAPTPARGASGHLARHWLYR